MLRLGALEQRLALRAQAARQVPPRARVDYRRHQRLDADLAQQIDMGLAQRPDLVQTLLQQHGAPRRLARLRRRGGQRRGGLHRC